MQQARAYLARNDITSTVKTLQAFVNEVKAQAGKKIPRDQAAALVATATRIARVLGHTLR